MSWERKIGTWKKKTRFGREERGVVCMIVGDDQRQSK